ncbi:glutamate receptor subunit 1 [Caerostris extrusa]|uniref:Glutamate receptor subunit 1 n=1 Tax=Caerostris extrusa TaxID=172846 RepID=A0AAV4UJ60_CAEEX|nr:glutamate receptor subunit 1 [Caerostris extrusa]
MGPVVLVLLGMCAGAALGGEADKVFNIGAVLSVGEKISHFMQAIVDVNEDMNTLPPRVKLEGCRCPWIGIPSGRRRTSATTSSPRRKSSTRTRQVILELGVRGDHQPSDRGRALPAAVSYTCGFYNIPVIGISSRDSSLSDKNLHTSFMRTIPPYSNQADVWIEILKFLNYKCVTFIHSSDNDGRSTLGRFRTSPTNRASRSKTSSNTKQASQKSARSSKKLRDAIAGFSFFMPVQKMLKVSSGKEALNMTLPGYVWIVSEQALLAPNKPDDENPEMTCPQCSVIGRSNEFKKPRGYIKFPQHLKVVTCQRNSQWIRGGGRQVHVLRMRSPCPRMNKRAVNGSEKKMWTGMVGDLVYERADMVVAPLHYQSRKIAGHRIFETFQIPGHHYLEKEDTNYSAFKDNFFTKDFYFVFCSTPQKVDPGFFSTTLPEDPVDTGDGVCPRGGAGPYLLDRFSPFRRYKLPSSDATEEDAS